MGRFSGREGGYGGSRGGLGRRRDSDDVSGELEAPASARYRRRGRRDAPPGRSAASLTASHYRAGALSPRADYDDTREYKGALQPTNPRQPTLLAKTGVGAPNAGPGHYESAIPAVGRQIDSKKPTAPAHVIGTAMRDDAIRRYVSPMMTAGEINYVSEDATGYRTDPMLINPVDSRKRSAAGTKFGTSPRFQTNSLISRMHAATYAGNDSPGPAYALNMGFSKRRPMRAMMNPMAQKKGTREDRGPKTSFGTSKRMEAPRSISPGPAHYASGKSVFVPTRPSTVSNVGFGTSRREQARKVFNPAAGSTYKGTESPGPAVYFPKSGMGEANPTFSRAPGFAMGDTRPIGFSDPLRKDPESEPAPGDYSVFGTNLFERPVVSKLKSAPVHTIPASKREMDVPIEAKRVPGPGNYNADDGLGPQPRSHRATSPRMMFGLATRRVQAKVYQPHLRHT